MSLCSLAGLAVFVGTMLTEGFVLVPYWRTLAATDFFAWYAANDRRLLSFFGPVTTVAALLALLTAVLAMLLATPGRWWALLAAALMIVVVVMFPLYFRRANESFAAATVSADDLAGELQRWAAWHWVRTVLSCMALTAAMLAR